MITHIALLHEAKEVQKTYKCDNCEKSFGFKGTLFRHIKHVHEGERTYKCDYCSKKFPRKDDKEKHEKTIHNIM